MTRRRLLRQWPALSHLYGLHPWDVERLTIDEMDAYLDDLVEYRRQMSKASKSEGR
jgi:hypothetical protein